MLDPEIQKIIDNHSKVENERVDCVELLKQVNFDMMNVYRAGMGLPPMEDK